MAQCIFPSGNVPARENVMPPSQEETMPQRRSDDILPPRILFIDAYDSFSNNIVALLQEQLRAEVSVVKIDDPKYLNDKKEFVALLSEYHGVVAGPGPGSPTNKNDVGLMTELWSLDNQTVLPTLAICLGFQSLAYAFGASVEQLQEPRHGTVAHIEHCNESIFANVVKLRATQYNSLHVKLAEAEQGYLCIKSVGTPNNNTTRCGFLQPLAWTSDDAENGPILMGLRHTSKPFWGIQFHPESVCTVNDGESLIRNWWDEAKCWLSREQHFRKQIPRRSASMSTIDGGPSVNQPWYLPSGTNQRSVQWKTVPFNGLDVGELCDNIRRPSEIILLESGTTRGGNLVNPDTGRFSIIGLYKSQTSERIEYHASTRLLQHFYRGHWSSFILGDIHIWAYLKTFVEDRKVSCGPGDIPFWGGLLGFLSYETGLQTLGIQPLPAPKGEVDGCFIYIERSIVVDHRNEIMFVQSIRANDDAWLQSTSNALAKLAEHSQETSFEHVSDFKPEPTIEEPTKADYLKKVRKCQHMLRRGESYELCLTDQTSVSLLRSNFFPSHSSQEKLDWSLYKTLREISPAPFSAYMRIKTRNNRVTILSSSPERFLSWSRNGRCQLRPIKGTVKKTAETTKAQATAILRSSKEQAENLMIADLIRHDLHGALGTGNVSVQKLMAVEEYESVYQLVSVLEGQIPSNSKKSGIDVLAASLPPGSMTGAPKKRSCMLLQDIENNKPRGIYSGVLGYLDVGGAGDFSVVIRTAVKWDKGARASDNGAANGIGPEAKETWTIGAGGAVTVQSNDVGEWEEMLAKRQSVLRIFQPHSQ